MNDYVVEMLWDCGACGRRRLRGLEPTCPGCHHEKDVAPGTLSEFERFPPGRRCTLQVRLAGGAEVVDAPRLSAEAPSGTP